MDSSTYVMWTCNYCDNYDTCRSCEFCGTKYCQNCLTDENICIVCDAFTVNCENCRSHMNIAECNICYESFCQICMNEHEHIEPSPSSYLSLDDNNDNYKHNESSRKHSRDTCGNCSLDEQYRIEKRQRIAD